MGFVRPCQRVYRLDVLDLGRVVFRLARASFSCPSAPARSSARIRAGANDLQPASHLLTATRCTGEGACAQDREERLAACEELGYRACRSPCGVVFGVRHRVYSRACEVRGDTSTRIQAPSPTLLSLVPVGLLVDAPISALRLVQGAPLSVLAHRMPLILRR